MQVNFHIHSIQYIIPIKKAQQGRYGTNVL